MTVDDRPRVEMLGRSTREVEVLPAEADLPAAGPHLERLVAQRSFFAGPAPQAPADLYAEVEHGHAVRERDGMRLHPRTRVSLNTYFGRFPASYWQRWSTATEIRVEVLASGSGTITALASDGAGTPRVLRAVTVGGEAETAVSLDLPLDRFVDGGALWLELSTDDDPLTVQPPRWSVPAPARTRPTAVVMCTFNRPDDCVATLETLAGDAEARLMVDAVYVIDQGRDLVRDHPGFAAVCEVLGSSLHYREQPNLGGAGGFTRGLYEVTEVERAEHANVLFMDDDILLEPDVVIRLTALANRSAEPVIVGAQMLQLLHPHRLHVSAETARFATLEPGLAVPNGLDRVDLTESHHHLRVDADYNAWWCCLIPSEVIADIGYPLPMFFQWDDVEFGYRARARGHATVTLPGAGIWHADFDWKDEDEPTRYFTLRNALIIDALHGRFRPAVNARVIGRWMAHCLISMRYAETATLIKAVEDFLAGPEVLRDGGARAIAEVAALRAGYPETGHHPASSVPGVAATERHLAATAPPPSRTTLVLAKRLITQLLGRTGGSVAVSAQEAHWWHVSRFARVVVTDASQQSVRLRQFDRAALVRLGRQAARVLRRLRRQGLQAQRRYRDAAPELASRESWQQRFADR